MKGAGHEFWTLPFFGTSGTSKNKPSEVILVPPLLERDHRGRSRLCKSSFDLQFCKPQLKWLFSDYLWPGAGSLLRFSPAEDRRVSVKARFSNDSLDTVGSNTTGMPVSLCIYGLLDSAASHAIVLLSRAVFQRLPRVCWYPAAPSGAVSLRFQPQPEEHFTFFDIKAATQVRSPDIDFPGSRAVLATPSLGRSLL